MSDRRDPNRRHEEQDDVAPHNRRQQDVEEEERLRDAEKPVHRVKGKIPTPRFGSAGSGGAEWEPGPEKP